MKSKRIYLCSLRIAVFALCIAAVLSGCKKDEPQSLYGNQPRPTWTASKTGDMTMSMTAVVKVEKLNGQLIPVEMVKDSDLVAAFIGETCMEVQSPQDGLFFLFINNQESGSMSPVTLRYYSSHYRNLFVVSSAFPFINESHLGTIAEPLVHDWIVDARSR